MSGISLEDIVILSGIYAFGEHDKLCKQEILRYFINYYERGEIGGGRGIEVM